MKAAILVGHGSLRSASGAAMIRLAARAQAAGVAPIVAAGFLNYSRPTFTETLDRVVEHGATEIVVQPYFLVPGKFVQGDIARLVETARATHPSMPFALAEPFNDHPAMRELVLKRAAAALPNPADTAQTALLLIAHGSPTPAANAPIDAIAAQIDAEKRFQHVLVCFLGLNEPSVPQAIDRLVAGGARQIVAVPYFLQFGGHAAEDVPLLLGEARLRHPATAILHAEHLGYDPLLVNVIADRVHAAQQDAMHV